MPESSSRRKLIDRLALYVSKDGQGFETLLMQQETAKPDSNFAFLLDVDCEEHQYYRWKVRFSSVVARCSVGIR